MKSNQDKALLEVIEKHPKIANFKQEDELITAFLAESLEAEEFIQMLFKNNIVLTHFVKRKESLEEQFLQLTDQQ
jgi:ABC-2 type transport system ATP-binding protein